MKPHTWKQIIGVLTHPPILMLVILLVVMLLAIGSQAHCKTPDKPPPCQGEVCYNCKNHTRLLKRVSGAITCKLKLSKRDAALAHINGVVTLWKSRDTASKSKIVQLTKQRDGYREEKEKAARQIRKAWTVFWSVTGSLVVVGAVVITVMAVTRPPSVSQAAPLTYPLPLRTATPTP